MTSAELAGLLAQATLGASAAIVLVFLLRAPLRRGFGAAAAYALWLLVPAASLAPWLPLPPALPAEALLAPVSAGMEASLAPVRRDGSELAAWLAAWATGALALLLVQAARQWRFRRRLGVLTARSDGAFAAAVDGPAVLGLLRPRILVPRDFDQRFTEHERALVLAHERVHIRRGDVPATALATLLQCLFWFNPLAHLALARFRRDQELACDAAVVARHPAARRDYARAMLNSQLAAPGLPVGCTWQSGHPLKERIMLLKHPVPGRLRRSAGAVLAVSLAIAAGMAVAGGNPPAEVPTADPETSYARLTRPKYPKEAIDAKMSGTVVLRILVGADGTPRQVEVERSDAGPILEQSAIASASKWLFNPAERDGQPVEGWVLVPINYSLDDIEPPPQEPNALDALNVRGDGTS